MLEKLQLIINYCQAAKKQQEQENQEEVTIILQYNYYNMILAL